MNAINLLRESIPNVKFSTDVIVGFPAESEDDFLQTVEFVKQAGFLTVHIFPYSKRKGTLAAKMSARCPRCTPSKKPSATTDAHGATALPGI